MPSSVRSPPGEPPIVKTRGLVIVSVRPLEMFKLKMPMSVALMVGCAPTLGITTSLTAGLLTPGAYCVPPAGGVQLVAVFQSVLVSASSRSSTYRPA